MEIGKLRHRIIIQTITEGRDSSGGPIETIVDLYTVWASVSPLTGRELTNAQLINSEVTHQIAMRYRAGINAKCRALFGTRIFQLFEALNIDEQNITLQIGAKEVLL